jgi:nucleoside-diphosphate-sugar epimerase
MRRNHRSVRTGVLIMQRVLVTGAGGYIGIPLCRELANRGYQVIALDRFFFGQDKLGDLSSNPSVRVNVQDIREIASDLLQGVYGVFD